MITLKRQFITDASGNPIGVILPLEEFALVKDILDQQRAVHDDDVKLERMEQAVKDPLFLADMHETMHAFADVDAEWWESAQSVTHD
jgi:hypothetical protein